MGSGEEREKAKESSKEKDFMSAQYKPQRLY